MEFSLENSAQDKKYLWERDPRMVTLPALLSRPGHWGAARPEVCCTIPPRCGKSLCPLTQTYKEGQLPPCRCLAGRLLVTSAFLRSGGSLPTHWTLPPSVRLTPALFASHEAIWLCASFNLFFLNMYSVMAHPPPEICNLTSHAKPDKWYYSQNVVCICMLYTRVFLCIYACV